jgi:hypothetical protein
MLRQPAMRSSKKLREQGELVFEKQGAWIAP